MRAFIFLIDTMSRRHFGWRFLEGTALVAVVDDSLKCLPHREKAPSRINMMKVLVKVTGLGLVELDKFTLISPSWDRADKGLGW